MSNRAPDQLPPSVPLSTSVKSRPWVRSATRMDAPGRPASEAEGRSVEKARQLLGYAPKSTFNEGIVKFAKWLGGTDAGGLAPPRGLPT